MYKTQKNSLSYKTFHILKMSISVDLVLMDISAYEWGIIQYSIRNQNLFYITNGVLDNTPFIMCFKRTKEVKKLRQGFSLQQFCLKIQLDSDNFPGSFELWNVIPKYEIWSIMHTHSWLR